MQSKNALGCLKNRYKAVLKKCNLLNVFGSLAVASMLVSPVLVNTATAAVENTATVVGMDATDGRYQFSPQTGQVDPNGQVQGSESINLTNSGVINGGVIYELDHSVFYALKLQRPSHLIKSGMFGYDVNNIDEVPINIAGYKFINDKSILVENEALPDYDGQPQSIRTLYGMYAEGLGAHEFINNGDITVNAKDISYDSKIVFAPVAVGMYQNGEGSKLIENSGTLTVTNLRETAITLSDDDDIQEYNTTQAHGIQVVSLDGSNLRRNIPLAPNESGSYTTKLLNQGTIDVRVQDTTDSRHDFEYHEVAAYGMSVAIVNSIVTGEEINDPQVVNLNNEGHMIVTAEGVAHTLGEGATFISAIGMVTGNDNIDIGYQQSPTPDSEILTVAAAQPQAIVTITNTGVIETTAQLAEGQVLNDNTILAAYDALVYSDVNVDVFALSLENWDAYNAVFAIDGDHILNFANGDKGATIIARPGLTSQGFALGKKYSVANMIVVQHDEPKTEVTNDTIGATRPSDDEFTLIQQTAFRDPNATAYETDKSTITGSIENVITEVNFIKATLHDKDTLTPSISLALDKDNIPTEALTANNFGTFFTQSFSLSQQLQEGLINFYNNSLESGLATGSETLMDNQWSVFGKLHASHTNNSKYGFDSDAYGVTAGGNYNFNESFSVGAHFDFVTSDSDAGSLESDANSFAFGLHANYFINNNWYARANATYAIGDNDFTYKQNIGSAKDDFGSSSFFASLNTGYFYQINQNNVIVPEIGLSYLYTNMDSYNLLFPSAYSMYNMNMHDTSHSSLYAHASVEWQGNFEVGAGTLSPSLGLGIRQNLTGADIDTKLDMFGTQYKFASDIDDTSFQASAGLEWELDNFSLSLEYNGDYSSNQDSHMGSLMFTYKF